MTNWAEDLDTEKLIAISREAAAEATAPGPWEELLALADRLEKVCEAGNECFDAREHFDTVSVGDEFRRAQMRLVRAVSRWRELVGDPKPKESDGL